MAVPENNLTKNVAMPVDEIRHMWILSSPTQEPPMTFTASTYAAAAAIATELRAIHVGTDWIGRVEFPLFNGDDFRVVVG